MKGKRSPAFLVCMGLLLTVDCLSVSAAEERNAQAVHAEKERTAWPCFQGASNLAGRADERLPERIGLLWMREVGKGISGGVVMDHAFAYVGTDGGDLCALDLRQGEEIWRVPVGAAIPGSPCLSGTLVVVADEEGNVHALRRDTGEKAWTVAVGEGAPVKASVIDAGNVLLVASYDFYLYALSPDDGRVVWKFETEERVHATPAAAGGLALTAGCDGWLRGIDLATGKQGLAVEIGSYIRTPPSTVDGCVYVCTFDGRVVAVDAGTQSVLWDTGTRYENMPHDASPAIGEKTIFIGGEDGVLRALSRADGAERWHVRTDGPLVSGILLSGKRVLAAGKDGVFRIVDEATGEEKWRFETGAPVLGGLAVANGRVLLAAGDGAVYCFGERRIQDP